MRRLPAEVVPRVPEPVRKVARTAIWGFGRATSRWRPLPDFLVLGAQKAGTTALYAYLRWHPGITGPSWKEVSFFDRHWWRGPAWYRGQFPLRSGTRLVGEASPSYLFHPLAPERVRALVPDARLVALVRDPVARAYSHYQHEVALGREPLSFEDALAAEPERTRGRRRGSSPTPGPSAAPGGITPTSRAGSTPTSSSAGLRSSPASSCSSSAARTSASVRPRPTPRSSRSSAPRPTPSQEYPRIFGREYADMPPETRLALAARFAEPNRRLEALLGRDLGWA